MMNAIRVRAPAGHEAELRLYDDRWSVRTRPLGQDWWATIATQDADTPDPARAAFDVRRWIENIGERIEQARQQFREDIARWGSE